MKKLNLKHSLTSWHGLRLLLLPLALLFVLWMALKYLTKMTSKNEIVSQVLNLLVGNGFTIKQAQFITAQAAHETGNFTSQVFHENNNLFGMTYVGQLNSLGDKNGYANYENIDQCIKDFTEYYRRSGYSPSFGSVAEYITTIKAHGYFEADVNEYVNGVEYFYKKYFNA